MRRLIILLLFLGLGLGFTQNSLDTIRQAIADGSYSSVVQVLGPDLLADDPNNAEAHLLFAYALYYTGDLAQARLEFDKAQVLSIETTTEVNRLNGLLKASEGDISGALDLLKQAFEESQDYGVAMDWGRIAWENGQTEIALEAFDKAAQTKIGQTQMWPYLNRGRILHMTLKDYQAAIEAYDKAIEIFDLNDPGGQPSPGYIEVFFRLGQVYEALGDLRTAKANYEVANQRDPNYEPAIEALNRLPPQSQ